MGLSQADLAIRMGTTQSAIARMESADADPRVSTVERYVAALGVELVVRESTSTLSATAIGIEQALKDRSPEDALRLAIQFADDVAHLGPEMIAAATREEPPSVGSRHWDALLAGLAEHVAHGCGIRVPGWATAPGRFLPDFWFVIEDLLGRPARGLAAIAFATSPPSFASRGVFLDRATLVSI